MKKMENSYIDKDVIDTCEIEGVFPEEHHGGHISLLDNSLLQQDKLSMECSSNVASSIILSNMWHRNSELLTADLNSRNVIYNTALSLLPNPESALNGMKEWKTCFENESSNSRLPLDLVGHCIKCMPYRKGSDFKHIRKDCSCNINNPDNSSEYKEKHVTFKPLSSEESFKEMRVGDEQRKLPGHIAPLKHVRQVKTVQPEDAPIKSVVGDIIDLEEDDKVHKANVAKITFKSAREQLLASNPALKRSLGATRKAQAKFVSPMVGVLEKKQVTEPEVTDERLKHIDPKMIELIESEIIDKGAPIGWDDIAGLQLAKSVIQEAVVWPLLRPDIFTGLRQPPKGILLFGPPGTGKTLIGKCIAVQCNATFFSISASSLTSKWLGDAEKMVRALFAVARTHQPAVIFIDEIDSLLSQRSDSEHDATRRIKTEFLVQFDGATTREEDRVLLIGATNRPQELDEAARRRFVKRLYIPLPDAEARKQLICNLLKKEMNRLSAQDIAVIATETQGYSCADMKSLCSEAAMGPIRSLPPSQIATIDKNKVRPVSAQDFYDALKRVKSSVSPDDLGQYVKWNETFGQES